MLGGLFRSAVRCAMASLRFAALTVFAALIWGCASSPEVSVQVLTDLAPVTQFDEVVVFRDGGSLSHVVSNAERYDQPRMIVEYRDVPSGALLELAAELRFQGRTVLRRTRSTVVNGSRIVLFTFTASCREIVCPMGDPRATECLGGRCVEPGCEGDACVEPECASDAECTAGSSCEAPRCVQGVCFQFADPSRCASGETCVPGMGCQMSLPDPDGGMPDAAIAPDAPSLVDAASAMDAARDASADSGFVISSDAGREAGAGDAGRDAGASDAGRDGGAGDAGRDSGLALAFDAGRDAGAADAGDTSCSGLRAGTVCRRARGPCDAEEVCGRSAACPPDEVLPPGTSCRPVARVCDVAEVCDGLSTVCPTDRFLRNGTVCNEYCGSETCSSGVCAGGMVCAPGFACCDDTTCSSRACL